MVNLARRAGSGGATKFNYRVGVDDSTAKGAAWVREEFGFDPNMIGHLTPALVRETGKAVHELEKQLAMAQVFTDFCKKGIDSQVKLEKLRADLIKHGLAKKEEVDALVLEIIGVAEKHGGHIEKMLKEITWNKATIAAETKSAIDLGQNKFENNLRLLLARHNQGLADQNVAIGQAIQNVGINAKKKRDLAAKEKSQQRNFMSYIKGEDDAGSRWSLSGSSVRNYQPARLQGGRRTAMGRLWS